VKPRFLPEIVRHALELFAPLGSIHTKAMFGGWGFYCDDCFFALAADNTLYLKTDGQSALLFSEAGGEPFRFSCKNGRMATMSYCTVPATALESSAEMLPWGQAALAAAVRQKKKPKATVSARRPQP
jgi:DNA transformation protein and related proteins